jgi:hypothetical protein
MMTEVIQVKVKISPNFFGLREQEQKSKAELRPTGKESSPVRV